MSAVHTDNPPRITGVNWDKRNKYWQTIIQVNKRRIYLGYFKELNDAIIARKNAERQYHQEIELAKQALVQKRKRYPSKEARVKAKAVRRQQQTARQRQIRPWRSYLMSLRNNAKSKGCVFTFDIDNTPEPTHCEVCGTVLQIKRPVNKNSSHSNRHFKNQLYHNSITADRIDPLSKEYGPDTVRFICWTCNRIKSDCSDSKRFRLIADYLDRYAITEN